jgi:hypothetical protein
LLVLGVILHARIHRTALLMHLVVRDMVMVVHFLPGLRQSGRSAKAEEKHGE